MISPFRYAPGNAGATLVVDQSQFENATGGGMGAGSRDGVARNTGATDAGWTVDVAKPDVEKGGVL